MVKSREDVITGFHEQVNMSIDELQKWLDDPKSRKAGTGVGIESGHKIIKILKKNPDKDPEKYDEEDIDHMRKVVSYVIFFVVVFLSPKACLVRTDTIAVISRKRTISKIQRREKSLRTQRALLGS
ncbi:hypothetical protein IEO21_01207 [Rhodonia placenta]|uniref:Uncharacterized protein n=1 Tax=Rhodonia placenta TaxID=104341 RepID=A0A8H7U5K6_9APHY|nr:hypothetical protein IEO21_01207 [Postia placenta]